MIFIERRKKRREVQDGMLEFIKISSRQEVINKGTIVDESATGMGLLTDFQLLKGQPVIIRGGIDRESLKYGVICWCERKNGNYRSGMRYITNISQEV